MTRSTRCNSFRNGFTLVELLTVLSIASLLALLTIPAVQSLQTGFDFNRSLSAMQDSLNLARSFAMAQNTYVYVGLAELDRSQSSSVIPQVSGAGRLAVSLVATRDGTRDLGANSTGANLTQLRPVQTYEGIHVATGPFTLSSGNVGTMTRSTSLTPTPLVIAASGLTTTYSLPLGTITGSGKYNFVNNGSTILCFTPQGGVLLNGNVVQLLEIDLQIMKGKTVPSVPSDVSRGELAAFLIDGVTGSVTLYRP